MIYGANRILVANRAAQHSAQYHYYHRPRSRIYLPPRVAIRTAEIETSAGEEQLPAIEEKIAALDEYGWRVSFVREPGGKVTGLLQDYESGQTIKSVLGDDFVDAWLGLGIDTQPPSDEVRRERERRSRG
jgi:hypothetical protein